MAAALHQLLGSGSHPALTHHPVWRPFPSLRAGGRGAGRGRAGKKVAAPPDVGQQSMLNFLSGAGRGRGRGRGGKAKA